MDISVQKKGIVVLGLLCVGLVYFASQSIAHVRLNDYEQATRLLIADEQATLVAIAEVTARNGADAVTESIVRDCSTTERTEFDSLLSRLNNGLTKSELSSLERLFGRCGSFYSERKSMMVARLSREIELYKTYVQQLSAITGEDLASAFNVSKWEMLASEETRQSELFARLVMVQDEIIATLLAGKSQNSDEIQKVLQEAKEVQETLIVANKQASTLRGELIPL